jgi:hypothetical protein
MKVELIVKKLNRGDITNENRNIMQTAFQVNLNRDAIFPFFFEGFFPLWKMF